MHIRSRAPSVRRGPGKALQPLGGSGHREGAQCRLCLSGKRDLCLLLCMFLFHVLHPSRSYCCCSKEPFASLPRPSPVWAGGRGLPSRRRVVAVPQEGTALWQAITRHTYAYKHWCSLRGLEVATFSRGSDCDPLVLDKEPNPPASPPIPQGF